MKDKRIKDILEQLLRYKASDYSTILPSSGTGDDIDMIIDAINDLGAELRSKYARFNARINHMLEILLDYTVMNFSQKINISDNRDELDAVSAGLNALGEELQEYIEKLARSNNDLESLNQELDSFSYSVSHDLRAPLRSIYGYAKILEEDHFDKMDEDGKHSINVILRNSKKMGQLIDDLLTFSRLGKKDIHKRKVDMTALVQMVIDDVLASEGKDNIKINLKKLPSVKCDPVLMKQVWLNLLSNAMKYSAGRSNIFIEIMGAKNNNAATYHIKDNGVGFDMRYYNKLFGVFQRLHSHEEFEGTGVGLAIVQKIINKHQGEVWAESKLNEGAKFFFSLPIKSKL